MGIERTLLYVLAWTGFLVIPTFIISFVLTNLTGAFLGAITPMATVFAFWIHVFGLPVAILWLAGLAVVCFSIYRERSRKQAATRLNY